MRAASGSILNGPGIHQVCAVFMAALMVGLTSPSAAQDVEKEMFEGLFDACLSDAHSAADLENCKGQVAELCMEEVEGGQSTLGMSACHLVEAQLWQDVLANDWGGHLAWAEAADERERDFSGEQFANHRTQLVASQDAWVAFRDADCGLAVAIFGSGSVRHVIGTACRAERTADRVIALRSLTGVIQ